ncbi:MAG: hypothetical protein EP318_17485 [Rhodobacteraceae bacterium]|nr:MAG: hypothetical protein EP318_17485 [Paracoccaceae bacterium]
MLKKCAALATAVLIAVALPAPAQQSRPTDALLDTLALHDTVEVMRKEGISYGTELALDMLPGGAGESWTRAVERIYDTARMEETVRAGFARAWAAEDMSTEPIAQYFASDDGQQVVRLEISARDAMTEPGVEEAARAAFRDRDDEIEADPRLAEIARFIESNDLINANVVGAMNSSYEFYAGLVDGGAFEMSEDEILRVVWESEPDSRKETREWLFAYMMMAYQPLDQKVLSDYVDLAASEQGRALNRALFAGFDEMYAEISYALGLALARQMTAQEL